MKRLLNGPVLLFLGTLVILALACNLPGGPPTPAIEPSIQPVAASTGASEQAPPATSTTSANAPVSISGDRTSHAGDYDSSTTAAARKAAGGDRFSFGRLERPFNANTMDVYFPYLDIVDTTAYEDGMYIYGVLVLKGGDESGALPGNYAFELDMNNDGGGDWLVFARAPATTQWTTAGVQVWQDADDDVGGKSTVISDEHVIVGTGYEQLVAENGQGESPEAGWVRIDPNGPNTIHFAISFSLVGSDHTYMAGMWAGTDDLDPARFDINDQMTHEQAGAADPGLELYYPIKELAEIDNSCRMVIGSEPTGNDPGGCPEAIVVAPTQPKPPTKVPCYSNPMEVDACVASQGTWNYNKCSCKPCQKPAWCTGGHYVWNPQTCHCDEIPW